VNQPFGPAAETRPAFVFSAGDFPAGDCRQWFGPYHDGEYDTISTLDALQPPGGGPAEPDREDAMKRWCALLAAALMVCLAAGCGDGGEKGKYRDREKPRAAEKDQE
jgi:hypothetical protein